MVILNQSKSIKMSWCLEQPKFLVPLVPQQNVAPPQELAVALLWVTVPPTPPNSNENPGFDWYAIRIVPVRMTDTHYTLRTTAYQ